MWRFRETVARDGRTYDFKHHPALVLREKWQNLVKLIERAGPAVNEHDGKNPLIWAVCRPHMDEVHVQSYNKVFLKKRHF